MYGDYTRALISVLYGKSIIFIASLAEPLTVQLIVIAVEVVPELLVHNYRHVEVEDFGVFVQSTMVVML